MELFGGWQFFGRPVLTVKGFPRIKLDSVSDSNEDNMAYRILGGIGRLS